MNFQLMAKVIYSNKLASKEQVEEAWKLSGNEKNVGLVLVEQGVLTQQHYDQVYTFVEKKELEQNGASQVEEPVATAVAEPEPEADSVETIAEESSRIEDEIFVSNEDIVEEAPRPEGGESHEQLFEDVENSYSELEEEPVDPVAAALNEMNDTLENEPEDNSSEDPVAAALNEMNETLENQPKEEVSEDPVAAALNEMNHSPKEQISEEPVKEEASLEPSESALAALNDQLEDQLESEDSHFSNIASAADYVNDITSLVQETQENLQEAEQEEQEKEWLESGALPADFEGQTGLGNAHITTPESLSDQNSLQEILAFARANEASDIHLIARNHIFVRKFGSLTKVSDDTITADRVKEIILEGLLDRDRVLFEEHGDLETVLVVDGFGRFRVTVIKHRFGYDLTARVIPSEVKSFEDLKLPEQCAKLTKWAQGMVLITGPIGCGKTSTLATLVEMINQERKDHIISVESPIEIVYSSGKCQLTQREVKLHTQSEANALKGALRQDPDIIVVSELRDPESIQLAMSAAETGHLVLGTMNTNNAIATLSKLIDSFPPDEQDIVRNMVSESLRGIISQQLIPNKEGDGMLVAYEILMITTPVANLIRKNQLHQIPSIMITGKADGMLVLDDSLAQLVASGQINGEDAYYCATQPQNFEEFVKGK